MTGLICLDKPSDITSFFAVNKLRKILGEKKAGHTGTLDPMATGVLPIALGNATRFIELLPSHDKGYIAKVIFGLNTETGDITGKVVQKKDSSLTILDLEEAISHFQGEIFQTPPMYSAVLKDGVRLYEFARKGIEVEREERKISIKELTILDFNAEKQEAVLKVECSAGTYIRSLASDIAKKLGNIATLSELRRTLANGYSIEECHTIDEIKNYAKEGKLNEILIRVEHALKAYEMIEVTQAQAVRFSNGGELSFERLKADFTARYYRVFSPEGLFLGVGETDFKEMQLKVKRVFQG